MNAPKVVHEKDSDCTLDPETDECRECGVWHGDPLSCCGGRGFHRDACPEMNASSGDYASQWGESGGEGR